MGCASSKRIEAAVDVYRPSPASFAVFDINAIEEPWVKADDTQQQQNEKPPHLPPPIIDKLSKFEEESDAPHSWSEVSKALEDLKPALASPDKEQARQPAQDSTAIISKDKLRRKSFSFHTLDELESKLSPKPTELKKTESMRKELKKTDSGVRVGPVADLEGFKPVRENIFVVRDRLEKGAGSDNGTVRKWDPLSDLPEKCPPGGCDTVVLYTTTLHGVRRTYEDCERVRSVLEGHRVVFDERDVALHSGFLNELREMLGEGVSVPRLFVKGRYVGGVEEVVGMNEMGRLGRLLRAARVERGVGWKACEGCGGARFVPCLECGGSCKLILKGDVIKERCPKCNENGLIQCPACH